MSLREGCKEILKADCVDLEIRLHRGQTRAIKIEEASANKCAICFGNIISFKMPSMENNNQTTTGDFGGAPGGVIVFSCHHSYHQKCLRINFTNATNSMNSNQETDSLPTRVGVVSADPGWYCTICQSNTKQRSATNLNSIRIGRKLGLK